MENKRGGKTNATKHTQKSVFILEPEVACSVIAEGPGKTNLDLLAENSAKRIPTKIELKERNGDTLIDLTSVQLAMLEKKIAEKRQQICAEMAQIEDVLDQLNNLDMSAKVKKEKSD